MNVSDLARAHATLSGLRCFRYDDKPFGLKAVLFSFEGHGEKILSVNPDDDSLLWQDARPDGCTEVALESLFPRALAAFGLELIWLWEMSNQQGYFDALQIQLADESLQRGLTLQFKASASAVQVFEVLRLESRRSAM